MSAFADDQLFTIHVQVAKGEPWEPVLIATKHIDHAIKYFSDLRRVTGLYPTYYAVVFHPIGDMTYCR